MQVYLGAYDSEVQAARAHDIMALRSKDAGCELNFPQHDYRQIVPHISHRSQASAAKEYNTGAWGEAEVVAALRNYSKTLSASRQRTSAAAVASSQPPTAAAGAKRKQQQERRQPPQQQPQLPQPPPQQQQREDNQEGSVGPISPAMLSGQQHQSRLSTAAAKGSVAIHSGQLAAPAAGQGAGKESSRPTWQSPRLRAKRGTADTASAAAGKQEAQGKIAAVGPLQPAESTWQTSSGSSPLGLLSIPPLRLRPLNPPAQQPSAAGSQPSQIVGSPAGLSTQQQQQLLAAGGLGVGTPLSPASSLGVRNLLALKANQPFGSSSTIPFPLPLLQQPPPLQPQPQPQGAQAPPPAVAEGKLVSLDLPASPVRPLQGQLPSFHPSLLFPFGWPPHAALGAPVSEPGLLSTPPAPTLASQQRERQQQQEQQQAAAAPRFALPLMPNKAMAEAMGPAAASSTQPGTAAALVAACQPRVDPAGPGMPTRTRGATAPIMSSALLQPLWSPQQRQQQQHVLQAGPPSLLPVLRRDFHASGQQAQATPPAAVTPAQAGQVPSPGSLASSAPVTSPAPTTVITPRGAARAAVKGQPSQQ
ncbi:hypothetical protein N2152v2_004043 [Parachlorella kessleri]